MSTKYLHHYELPSQSHLSTKGIFSTSQSSVEVPASITQVSILDVYYTQALLEALYADEQFT